RLEDPRWFLVRNVIHILGELGDPAILPSLRGAARHEDARVRKEVVKTALRLGGPDAEALVVQACSDPDRTVQVAGAMALSGMKGPETEAVILDLIARTGVGAGADAEMRQEAIAAAGRRKMAEAVAPLREILRRRGLLGYTESTELRIAAARALGGIGNEEALEILRAASNEDARSDVREVALAILGEVTAGQSAR
ncbi:MAG: HEAT repeat domain-containing protein, partial [Candidatus Rokubacteria bacterium]|nr:HEAT repeat domain-containing protein [Candidatus Rokubacteria bacterium]